MTWYEVGLRLVLAVVAGCIIGVEREHKSRPAGMRTHGLVCVGAAMIAIIDCLNMAETLDANRAYSNSGIAISVGRMSAVAVWIQLIFERCYLGFFYRKNIIVLTPFCMA